MAIPSILGSGLLAGLFARSEETEATRPAQANSAAGEKPLGASFHQIAAQYNLERISPREFSELIQRLHAAGAVSDGDLQELSHIRLELDRTDAAADRSLDLLDHFRRAAHGQGADPAARRALAWIERLALAAAGPPVNSLA